MEKVRDCVARYVQGGVSEDMMNVMDAMIEEGVITQEYFDANEVEIMSAADEIVFTCENCSWTVPMEQMCAIGDWMCNDCAGENEHDD